MTDSKPINSVVLIKQVPDTHNVTGDVMTKDGTMNRSALPTIFKGWPARALSCTGSLFASTTSPTAGRSPAATP